jgi:hypothetical protein
MGIHGGDNRRHEKLFGQFQVHRVALDDPDVQFGEGFTELEPGDSGPAGYIWMGRRALLTLPNRQEAKFLRLLIIPGTPPHFGFNAGSCRVNGGEAEPFDNTCSEIVFPLARVRGARLDVEIEMETTFRVGDDPRDLGLAVAGIQFLY